MRPQEVDVPEVRPVGLAEVELRVRALPEQEAGQPLLAAGADDQVRVGLALGVEVLGDVLDVEHLGQLLDRGAAAGVLLEQRTDRVGDLPSAAVADGDVDLQPRRAVAGALLGGLQRGGGRATGSRSSAPTGRRRQRRWSASDSTAGPR